jgi:hypothetical protein
MPNMGRGDRHDVANVANRRRDTGQDGITVKSLRVGRRLAEGSSKRPEFGGFEASGVTSADSVAPRHSSRRTSLTEALIQNNSRRSS